MLKLCSGAEALQSLQLSNAPALFWAGPLCLLQSSSLVLGWGTVLASILNAPAMLCLQGQRKWTPVDKRDCRCSVHVFGTTHAHNIHTGLFVNNEYADLKHRHDCSKFQTGSKTKYPFLQKWICTVRHDEMMSIYFLGTISRVQQLHSVVELFQPRPPWP